MRTKVPLSAFQIDRKSTDPLHRQLYHFLRRAIVQGELPADAPLPSTRALARRLAVSRNTVVNAYESLMTEGLLNGKIGSGTRVRRISDPTAYAFYPQALDPRRVLRESHYPTEARSLVDPDGNLIYIHR
ncbi:MAG TPA: winged helix-turn-helix domain-containing protein [Bryobacteraceae bacterium]|nr:winged helix-turn-helix domain-containing protein [Bryobacteraceae bacterium]